MTHFIESPPHVWYTGGYKFKTEADYCLCTRINTHTPGGNSFVRIDAAGNLSIAEGYAWDGASGPAINTTNFMRGSLVHDALYQLIREGYLNEAQHREQADRLLVKITQEDGMSKLRALWVYAAVRNFGGLFLRKKPAKWKVAPELTGEI